MTKRMSKLDVLIDYSKRGAYDEVWTPREALEYLLPYIPRDDIIWECAPGAGYLEQYLEEHGFKLAPNSSKDFLREDNIYHYDIIITNPPYSKKREFLERCYNLGKPWALLLPVTTLGVRRCQKYLEDADIIFLPKRIDFTGKKAPWFAVAWFTYGLGLDKQVTFVLE